MLFYFSAFLFILRLGHFHELLEALVGTVSSGKQVVQLLVVKLAVEAKLVISHRNLHAQTLRIVGRWEQRVQRESQTTVDEVRNYFLQQWARGLEARIRVALNQVHLEIIIEHEVVAQYLKRVLPLVGVEGAVASSHRLSHDALDLREDMLTEVNVQVWRRAV